MHFYLLGISAPDVNFGVIQSLVDLLFLTQFRKLRRDKEHNTYTYVFEILRRLIGTCMVYAYDIVIYRTSSQFFPVYFSEKVGNQDTAYRYSNLLDWIEII